MELRAQIASYIEDSRRCFGLPQFSLGMVIDGHRREVFGTTSGAPAQHLLYKVGSLTKLVTALAVLKLQENGRLRLDDAVSKHLSWFDDRRIRPVGQPVTVQDLLMHTGGLPRGDHLSGNPSVDQVRLSLENTVAPRNVAPRSTVKYSNLGYVVLGSLIETVASEPFADFVGRWLLSRLAMSSSGFGDNFPGEMTTPHRLSWPSKDSATPYDCVPMRLLSAPHSSHDMFSTVEDFSRLLACLLNGGMHEGQCIIQRPSILSLFGTGRAVNRRLRSGLGIQVVRAPYGDTFFENGEHFGHSAAMLIVPEKKFALVAMTNRGSAGLDLAYILSCIARYCINSQTPDALDRAYHNSGAVAGRYTDNQDCELTVTQKDGHLCMSVNDEPAMSLVYMGQGRFLKTGGAFAKYGIRLSQEGGTVQGLCIGPLYFRKESAQAGFHSQASRSSYVAGVYCNSAAGKVALFERNGRLVLAFSPFKEAVLEHISNGTFIQKDGPYAGEQVVLREAEGTLGLGKLIFAKTDEGY